MNIVQTTSTFLILWVSLSHFGFMFIEMYLWQKPLGLKIFKNTPEFARASAKLAANQGLYNGFLAAGLLISVFIPDPSISRAFQVFHLICVILAGVYGAKTVSPRIFWIQSFPAVLGLLSLTLKL